MCFSWKRAQFESYEAKGQPKPVTKITEADAIPEIECFQGPEDLLAAKLGTHCFKTRFSFLVLLPHPHIIGGRNTLKFVL